MSNKCEGSKLNIGQQRKKRYEKGSISIEASIALVAFIFFMISIISLINICRVQTKVGNALHLAALDISHYSYLYEVTGLYDMDVSIQEAGEGASATLTEKAKKADSMIANTETLLTILESDKDTAQKIVNSEIDPTEGIEKIQDSLGEAQLTIQEMEANFDQVAEEARGIAENPILFVKTLAQCGIGEGFDQLKNYMAGVLAKSLMQDHIEAEGTISDADAYLESLGIVDGLDGMHFGASQIYSGEDHADINLVVMYEVKIFPLMTDATMPFAQSASTRAWLNGDADKVDAPAQAEEAEDDTIWNNPNFPRYEEAAELVEDQLDDSGTYIKSEGNHCFGYDTASNIVHDGNSIDIFAKTYRKSDGTMNMTTVKSKIRHHLNKSNKKLHTFKLEDGSDYTLPDEFHLSFVIYVPENASDEEIAAIQQIMDEWAAENPDLPEGLLSRTLKVERIGGDSPKGS